MNPNAPGPGIIGLGPSASSQVRIGVNSPAGDTPLDRIFQQNLSAPNFLSILLERVDDQNTTAQTGQLTVGTVLPGFENITSQKQLPALTDKFVQHWQTALDPNGIIGPDGVAIQTTTTLSASEMGSFNTSQLHVIFDTGFTIPQVPQNVADAIYGRVPGATWNNSTQFSAGYWNIPCDYELNVTFQFNGEPYPVSALDLNYPDPSDPTGKTCMAGVRTLYENATTH